MTSLYTVKAIAAYDWQGTEESIILTTLDKEKAIKFADTYYSENHLAAIAIVNYDLFYTQVLEYELDKECSENIIYQTIKTQNFKIKNTSFPRLFVDQFIEKELARFYKRKGSVPPQIITVTIGDAVNNRILQPQFSDIKKEEFLRFIKKDIERKISFVTYENNIHHVETKEEKIDDSLDWLLYDMFEKKYVS